MEKQAIPSERVRWPDGVARLKQQAAERAVEFVESGMVVGLGHGSTDSMAVYCLARLLHTGELADICAVPCSKYVEEEARRLGIPLTTLESNPVINLTLDGADEVDPNLDLIKGLGGALLREKVVAQASQREIIIADDRKLSPCLGTQQPVPVEVISFGSGTQADFLKSLGARVALRKDERGRPFITDSGNLILDCHFGPIAQPSELAARLNDRAGVVEHGLFLGLASDLIVPGTGGVRHVRRNSD